MRVRRLTDSGLERMGVFLDSQTTDAPEPSPAMILTDPETSETLPLEIRVDPVVFPRRFEAAQYLHEHLAPLREPDNGWLERDPGLWAWLALFWFDQLCPPGRDGARSPGARARWIPSTDDPRRYYRHLLLGPYLIYRAYPADPERAMVLLCTRLHAPGEIVEQFVSRPQLVTCACAVDVATRLYHVRDGGFRRGAAGKDAGGARRLADVLMQLDRTYDLYSLTTEGLLALLPREFNRFRD